MHLSRGAVQFNLLLDRGGNFSRPAVVSSENIVNLQLLDCIFEVPETPIVGSAPF